MSKIILTKGLPASSKTTWAKQYVFQNPNVRNICKDDLRLQYTNYKENKIIAERNALTRDYLKVGLSVIWSDTNLNPIHEQTAQSIAAEFGAEVEINDSFLFVPIEECIKRDNARANGVGESVIKEMYYKYLAPKPKEVIFNPELPNCIICDIDGCLAKKSPDRGYFEWDKVGLDSVNEHIKQIVNLYFSHYLNMSDKETECNQVFIFSGRDGVCFEETEKWLENNGINHNGLFMRPMGNQEKDRVIKERLYREHIEGKYNVELVIDDRLQLLEFWCKLGLPVLSNNPLGLKY